LILFEKKKKNKLKILATEAHRNRVANNIAPIHCNNMMLIDYHVVRKYTRYFNIPIIFLISIKQKPPL